MRTLTAVFVVMLLPLVGKDVIAAPSERSLDPAHPTVDPSRFLGVRTSSWGNRITSKLVITKASPGGVLHGSYSWDARPFGQVGSIDLRAVIHDRSFAIGVMNNSDFPFIRFTLNDDGTISAVQQAPSSYYTGTFSKPQPVTVTPFSPNPMAFKGLWQCSWKIQDFGGGTAQSTLEVDSIDPVTKQVEGSYQFGNITGGPAKIFQPVSKRFTGSIEGDSLAFHGTNLEWKWQVEFVLLPDGHIDASRYIFYGYREHESAVCAKGNAPKQASTDALGGAGGDSADHLH